MTAREVDRVFRAARDPMGPATGADLSLLEKDLGDRWAPEPAFLERATADRLARTTLDLVRLIRTLPERMCGGSLRRFGVEIGLSEHQIEAIFGRCDSDACLNDDAPELGRADVIMTQDGPRLLEINLTSALGAPTIGSLNRAFLAEPRFAAFAREHGLEYVDPAATIACALAAATDCSSPRVAIVDTADNLALISPRLEALATSLRREGVTAVVRSPGQLKLWPGSRSDDGTQVDAVLRYFLVEDLLTRGGADDLRLLLDAARSRQVALCTPLESDIFGSKGALALLSEHVGSAAFDADERALAEDLLPWTRMVREQITDIDGVRQDVVAYARARRDDLVLKPTLLHGGSGVVLGWECTPDEWDRRVRAAVGKAYVLQQRAHPRLEPVGSLGSPTTLVRNWGIYFGASAERHGGFGGAMVRSVRAGRSEMVSWAAGATVGCVFLTPSAEQVGQAALPGNHEVGP